MDYKLDIHPMTIYLIHPYRDPIPANVHRNIQEAWTLATELIQLGKHEEPNGKKFYTIAPITPHLIYMHMDGCADEQWFLDVLMDQMAKQDSVLASERWKESRGGVLELSEAVAIRKPIYYWPEDKDQLLIDSEIFVHNQYQLLD